MLKASSTVGTLAKNFEGTCRYTVSFPVGRSETTTQPNSSPIMTTTIATSTNPSPFYGPPTHAEYLKMTYSEQPNDEAKSLESMERSPVTPGEREYAMNRWLDEMCLEAKDIIAGKHGQPRTSSVREGPPTGDSVRDTETSTTELENQSFFDAATAELETTGTQVVGHEDLPATTVAEADESQAPVGSCKPDGHPGEDRQSRPQAALAAVSRAGKFAVRPGVALYNWVMYRSTRKRAVRTARKHTKRIMTRQRRELSDGLMESQTPPTPVESKVSGKDGKAADSNKQPVTARTEELDTPSESPAAYKRGERAQELSAAAELKFGNMPYSLVNKEVVRRFMSGHELVDQSCVRFAHRAALVQRALEEYFVKREGDLVEAYVFTTKKNTKRTRQFGLRGY